MEPIDVRECIVCTMYVMNVSVCNSHESVILYELFMGKLVSVVKRFDVRGCIVCTLFVMYVSMGSASPLKYITYNVQTMHSHTPTRFTTLTNFLIEISYGITLSCELPTLTYIT